MDLSAKIVIIVMTILLIGFIVWMGIYSRRNAPKNLSSDRGKTDANNEQFSQQSIRK